jgi:ribosomal-protein-alanine N-acetyltransferase
LTDDHPEPRLRAVTSAALTLEPQTTAHAAELFALLQDPAIYEHENEPPESLEWLRTRFGRLETRRSADGTEHWLNWVVRLPSGEAAGYVQATITPDRRADIAYVFGSRFWGRGLASEAVRLMIGELVATYAVTRLTAVLKRTNGRSERLLQRLGFREGSAAEYETYAPDPDEWLYLRAAVAP